MSATRLALIVPAGAALLAGCTPTAGLNVPLEEVRLAPWHYELYQPSPAPAAQPERIVHADGRSWFAYDAPHRFFGAGFGIEYPEAAMQPIGAHDDVALYAFTWDDPPFGRLFARLGPGRWREYRPVAF